MADKKEQILKERLDGLYDTYHSGYLESDPLKFLHRYEQAEDIEIVGLITSSLAYGRVDRIFKSLETIFDVMGNSPSDFVKDFDPARDAKLFDGFVHRFNKGEDIACLIWFLKQVLEEQGSLGGLFKYLQNHNDANIGPLLAAFSDYMLSLDSTPFYGGKALPKDAGVRYFFPSPKNGSACKRLCLFLRWMVRKDKGLDFGLWDFIPASKLIIPLDTHLARLSQQLGFTKLKSPGWKMALEVTQSLKKLDPKDPLRYDFALCRLGILDVCPKKKDEEKCKKCGIKDVCRL